MHNLCMCRFSYSLRSALYCFVSLKQFKFSCGSIVQDVGRQVGRQRCLKTFVLYTLVLSSYRTFTYLLIRSRMCIQLVYGVRMMVYSYYYLRARIYNRKTFLTLTCFCVIRSTGTPSSRAHFILYGLLQAQVL